MLKIKQNYSKRWEGLPSHVQTKIRFLIIGIFNTVWGLALYPILYYFASPLGFHYLVILVFNYILNMSVAYITNKYFVFKTAGNYLKEYSKFAILQIICFIINLAALPALVEFANLNPAIAQTIFAILVIISSYFWHSRITFVTPKRE